MDVDELIDLELVHEIHTSERRSYRACRRRWDWIFRQNYYPLMTAKPLEFGVAFHYGMEKYYDPDTWDWPRDVVAQYAIKAFVDKGEEQRKKALENSQQQYLDADIQEDYDERVELGKGMLNHYFKHVAPQQDKGWRPVKVEIGFMIPIPHPDTREIIYCKCAECRRKFAKHFEIPAKASGRTSAHKEIIKKYWRQGLPVVYAGRCDMLAEDEVGNYWIFDWKTARTITQDDEFLYLDDQIGSYVWALRKLGLPVRGFVYHEQRKGYPKPPERNKVIRLGRSYSVSKSQETDYETYLRTVMEGDAAAYQEGLYDDFLAFLKDEGIVFHARHQIHKTDYECDQIEYNIGQEALEMIDPKIRIYPSAGRFGCTFCAFRQPCMEKNGGGDYQYALDTLYERREHYYVRTEASTESKGAE